MEKKKCMECGKELIRRSNGTAVLESNRDFSRRRFCDKKCAGKFSRRKAIKKSDEIKNAGGETGTGASGEKTTARAYLEQVVAGEIEGVDTKTKINVAKALLPYQEEKNQSEKGKKETREDKAKVVSGGKFGAGKPPVVMVK